MPVLSIIIPSRLQRSQSGQLFLEQAVQSIRAQDIDPAITLQILVGIDQGAAVPGGVAQALGVSFVESPGKSQAAALNAAARAISGDFVAFLEDDDRWNPGFLAAAFAALREHDFSSSTQLEVDTKGEILRVNDFPTPSGWVMRRETWDRVGPFNADFRFHLDNEWLGRLGEARARRVHLVEATVAIDPAQITHNRPLLGTLLSWARPGVGLARHASPWPLVVKLCHPRSGISQTESDPLLRQRSQDEYAQLIARFGCVPW